MGIAIRSTTLLMGLCFVAVGCAKYESAPITHERGDKDLAEPTSDQLQVAASKLSHPILKPVQLDPAKGLSPDDLAVIAVIVNPSLRAERQRRNIATAELVQAGLLPNPQLVGSIDFPHGSAPPDNFTAWG